MEVWAVLPGLGGGLAVEDAEGGLVGIAGDDLYAVWIDGADAGEDEVVGGVDKGRGGKVEDGGEEEGVDDDVGGGEGTRLGGQREQQRGQRVGATSRNAFVFLIGRAGRVHGEEPCGEQEGGVKGGDGEADEARRNLQGVSGEKKTSGHTLSGERHRRAGGRATRRR